MPLSPWKPHSCDEDLEILAAISALRAARGPDLVILTHHYQRPEIVAVGDVRGDSLALAVAASRHPAKHIVFCGVHFMAESAAILARPQQTVQLPDLKAGCQMADMVSVEAVELAYAELAEVVPPRSVLPVVYVNSDAELKAWCGWRGGLTFTSANARAALSWAFARADKVFFFPDQYLGRNVGEQLGLTAEDMVVWDPEEPLGGLQPRELRRARLLLWQGYCHVHTRFRVEHLQAARETWPGARIVVHPECLPEVVAAADACGSTGFIVRYVATSPPGSTILIGTEINLVRRLAQEFPDRQVLELAYSLCPNMFRLTPKKLLTTLENLGEHQVVRVPPAIREGARLALRRMLALTPEDPGHHGRRR
jgi:quinolinate synthase